LYEYDSDIEGGERHKKDWINHASDLLRESFPAPTDEKALRETVRDVVSAMRIEGERGLLNSVGEAFYNTLSRALSHESPKEQA
jgi:hypothetical protein